MWICVSSPWDKKRTGVVKNSDEWGSGRGVIQGLTAPWKTKQCCHLVFEKFSELGKSPVIYLDCDFVFIFVCFFLK